MLDAFHDRNLKVSSSDWTAQVHIEVLLTKQIISHGNIGSLGGVNEEILKEPNCLQVWVFDTADGFGCSMYGAGRGPEEMKEFTTGERETKWIVDFLRAVF